MPAGTLPAEAVGMGMGMGAGSCCVGQRGERAVLWGCCARGCAWEEGCTWRCCLGTWMARRSLSVRERESTTVHSNMTSMPSVNSE